MKVWKTWIPHTQSLRSIWVTFLSREVGSVVLPMLPGTCVLVWPTNQSSSDTELESTICGIRYVQAYRDNDRRGTLLHWQPVDIQDASCWFQSS
jgi:hypothetical protein